MESVIASISIVLTGRVELRWLSDTQHYTEVCSDVCIETTLQPIAGKALSGALCGSSSLALLFLLFWKCKALLHFLPKIKIEI